jgi:hypothetical protein
VRTPRGFYVYALKCPIWNQVFYYGKGVARRAWDHIRDAEKAPSDVRDEKLQIIKHLLAHGLSPQIEIISDELDEAAALRLEAYLINNMKEHIVNRHIPVDPLHNEKHERFKSYLFLKAWLGKMEAVPEWVIVDPILGACEIPGGTAAAKERFRSIISKFDGEFAEWNATQPIEAPQPERDFWN